MYHAHFKGTHYEAGYRWGSLLFRHQNIILEKVPFEITPERTEFALSCLPLYETYYPEILEEIQGLADGQHCSVRTLQAVLLSMYALPPVCSCSCFAFASEKEILLGRNSDFLPSLEKQNLNVLYRLTDGAYAFTGNTTAFVEIEDGVNEHGLAAGLTSVYPRQPKPGLHAGLLLRYLLEKCRNVPEALSCLQRLPIASAQTFTLADSAGRTALVECSSQKAAWTPSLSQEFSFVCATNAFHLADMAPYNCKGIDDWYAQPRYETLCSAFQEKGRAFCLSSARKLLSGKYGFLCQYDRSTGKDTVWSVIYDLKASRIYRCEGNPKRRSFQEDRRFSF